MMVLRMWSHHIDHIQDMTVSQELNTATQISSECPVSEQDNADSASDAFMFDSVTEASPTVQNDTAPSDSNTHQNVLKLQLSLHLVTLKESQSHLNVICDI